MMMRLLILSFCLFLAAPAFAQSTRDKVDMGVGVIGISAASIALGLTMACTGAQTCRENNPLMAKWIGDGPVKATAVKAGLNGASYYAAWRFTHGKPKARTLLLGILTAVNVWDAVHDVRQARR